MDHLTQRLQRLATRPAQERRRLLAATLPHAEPDEVDPIAQELLIIGDQPALRTLIEHTHRLSDTLRDGLAGADGPVAEAARALLNRPDHPAARHALTLTRTRAEAALLPDVARLLRHPATRENRSDTLRTQAAETILHVTRHHAPGPGRDQQSHQTHQTARPAALAALDRALAAALAGYADHRRREVLLASLLLAHRPGPHLAAVLDDRAGPAALALRSMIDDHGEPLIRRRLLLWLGCDRLRRAAARTLHTLSGPEAYNDLLSRGHLLLAPRRRRMLKQADRPMQCAPEPHVAVKMAESAQRWLPDFVDGLSLRRGMRGKRLAEMIALPSPLARVKMLPRIAAHAEAGSDDLQAAMERLALDRDDAVASLAGTIVMSCTLRDAARFAEALPSVGERCPEGSPDSAGDDLSPNPAALWRRIERRDASRAGRAAGRHLAGLSGDEFARRAGHLSFNDLLAAGRKVRAGDPDDFARAARIALELGERPARLAIITLLRRLRQVDRLLEPLIALSTSGDGHVASAAVAALGDSRSPRRITPLYTALRHGAARVRANAIEALRRVDEPGARAMVGPLLRSRDNRPRANAIWCALSQPDEPAVEVLRSMLRDRDPLHRISALWVARRARAAEVIVEVKHLAERDSLSAVRERAAAIARWLERAAGQARDCDPTPARGLPEAVLR